MAVGLAVAQAACAPTPVAPAGAGVVVTPASATAPPALTVVPFASQPIQVLVTVGTVTPATAPLLTAVEVATDAQFVARVAGVAVVGAPGTTVAVTLPTLAADQTYYWRVRSSAGSSVVLSEAVSFAIGPAAAIAVPQLETVFTRAANPRPAFVVRGLPGRRHPTSHVVYRFEIARSPSFLPIVASGTVAERPTMNGDRDMWRWVPDGELDFTSQFYWRVQAIDTATNASAYSEVRAFTTGPATMDGLASLYLTLPCGSLSTHGVTFAFDGSAEVTPDRIRFHGNRPVAAVSELVVNLDRSGTDQVSGTFLGTSEERSGVFFGRVAEAYGTNRPAVAVGKALGDGRWTGTFSGFLNVHYSWGDGVFCNAQDMTWTLYPR